MKAVSFNEHGGPEVLSYSEDAVKPSPAAGEVLVRQHAAGLNFVDLVVRAGYPGLQLPLPHSPGGDIAGEVAQLGEGVEGWTVGERVVVYPLLDCGDCALCQEGQPNLCLNWQFIGMHKPGGYQEYLCVPQRNLIKLPDNVSYTEAAALPVAGLTAYHALETVGGLKPGQTFFIWGGSGGLGSIAIQLAKQMGARVIATGSTDEKVELMQRLGADLAINRKTEDVAAKVWEFAPHGVDLLLDYVGPETFPTSFELIKKGGAMLLCGMITGRESMLSLHMTYLRHISIRGLYLGTKDELTTLVGLVSAGTLKPHVTASPPLADAAEWHKKLASGEVVGKVVFQV